MGSLLHGFLSGSIRFLSVVLKNLYHKIDLSPNHIFKRWRAYLKVGQSFQAFRFLLAKGKRIAVKNCTAIKPLESRFVSHYVKRLRATGEYLT